MGFWRSTRDFLLGAEPPEQRSFLGDLYDYFTFGGSSYPILNQTWGQTRGEEIGGDLDGVVQGVYRRNGVAAAAMFIRMAVFSEARFVFRRRFEGRPGELFGASALGLLERPWPGGTTGDLLARMLNDADLTGNAFVANRGDRLARMRPDWTSILVGVPDGVESDGPVWEHIDAEVAAYVYQPGGKGSSAEAMVLLPEEVAHFAPIPDPLASFRGMSWLTPVLREVQGDNLATVHKTKFFENAASPNMVVTLDTSDEDTFKKFVKLFEDRHEGAAKAYKTLFLGAGAQAKVVGSSFREMDFRSTIGVSEARIAMAAGVPPTILGTSEGLQGSSLNAGNYGQARRRFADGTMRPLWRQACGALEPLIAVPAGAELWFDPSDIPFLQEDQKDEADIRQADATTIRQLVDGGYNPDSVVEAVVANDMSRLSHSGRLSVQLQDPDAAPADDLTEETDDG